MPDWQELLTSLARRDEVCPAPPRPALSRPAPPCLARPPTHLSIPPYPNQVCLSEEEVAELQSLTMPDQAAVIAARLARTGGDALQGRLLQELVVAQMGAGEYSITHGLLAGMRLQAVVTTNYDTLFEAACAGAQLQSRAPPSSASARA